jgi:hypothetical protein
MPKCRSLARSASDLEGMCLIAVVPSLLLLPLLEALSIAFL